MELIRFVGTRIKELRQGYRGQGLSQEALAAELGTTANTISRWETGTYKPSLEDLERLSGFFEVPIQDFFPKQEAQANDSITKLMRTAQQLEPADIAELQTYAEFRRTRNLYSSLSRPKPGRKAKSRG